MSTEPISILRNANKAELTAREALAKMLRAAPIPDDELWQHLPLFINRQCLTQMLFMNEIYQRIVEMPGIICEFGVRFGRNIALYQNLAGIYEPFNHTRQIVGFDTFEGFPNVSAKDGNAPAARPGSFAVGKDYELFLDNVLDYHRHENPIPHILRYEMVKGDAAKTIPYWMEDNPHAIVALAYFDFDLYEPTRVCLQNIIPRLVKGSVLVFDEFNCKSFPGETLAAMERLNHLQFHKSKFAAHQAYAIW